MTNTFEKELMPQGLRQIVQRLAQQFGELPQVVAVVLAGSRGAGASDEQSDVDLTSIR